MIRIYVKSLANVEREWRDLYVVDAEHGWRLDCDIDEVDRGLKSALRKERETRHELEKRIRHLTTKDGAEALVAFNGTLRATIMAKDPDAG